MRKTLLIIMFLATCGIVVAQNSDENTVFTTVDQMPEFPGGLPGLAKYLSENVSYPQTARESGIQGRVIVYFVIETNGRVSNTKVIRGIGGGCDEEAVRVVNAMPRWKPAKQEGKKVRVSFNLPINFKLTDP